MSITHIGENPLMSDVTIHNGVAYLSGQVAMEARGAPFADQAQAIFARIDDLLKQAGTDRSKLLNVSIWLVDLDEFTEFNTLWQGWLKDVRPPARATVGARLVMPGLKLEIQVTAAV
ncbi:RidA family protein [Martelella soudanensis]|uniref:RidA family protein n=1 Tax=unclassified Martelella TaxID=2629616 RepID=UPI001FEDB18B|nr:MULTISPECIES: RidA family protein [unclassified Martelella]